MSEVQNTLLSTLVAQVADNLTLPKSSVDSVARALFEGLTAAVVAGETVRIHGVGTFTAVDTEARTGRNPTTGEALQIPASKRISFKPSKPFKDAVKATVSA